MHIPDPIHSKKRPLTETIDLTLSESGEDVPSNARDTRPPKVPRTDLIAPPSSSTTSTPARPSVATTSRPVLSAPSTLLPISKKLGTATPTVDLTALSDGDHSPESQPARIVKRKREPQPTSSRPSKQGTDRQAAAEVVTKIRPGTVKLKGRHNVPPAEVVVAASVGKGKGKEVIDEGIEKDGGHSGSGSESESLMKFEWEAFGTVERKGRPVERNLSDSDSGVGDDSINSSDSGVGDDSIDSSDSGVGDDSGIALAKYSNEGGSVDSELVQGGSVDGELVEGGSVDGELVEAGSVDGESDSDDDDIDESPLDPATAEETIYRSQKVLVRPSRKRQRITPQLNAFITRKLGRKQTLASKRAGVAVPLHFERSDDFYTKLSDDPNSRARVKDLLQVSVKLASGMVQDPLYVLETETVRFLCVNDPHLRELLKDYLVDKDSQVRNDHLIDIICDYCVTPTGWRALLYCAKHHTLPDQAFWAAAQALIAIDNPIGVYADVIDFSIPPLPDSTPHPSHSPDPLPRRVAKPLPRPTTPLLYIGKAASELQRDVPRATRTADGNSDFNATLSHDNGIRYGLPPDRQSVIPSASAPQSSTVARSSASSSATTSDTPLSVDYPEYTTGMSSRCCAQHGSARYRLTDPSLHYDRGYAGDHDLAAPTTNVQATIYPLAIIPEDFDLPFGLTRGVFSGYIESLFMILMGSFFDKKLTAHAERIGHKLTKVDPNLRLNVIPGTVARPMRGQEPVYNHEVLCVLRAPGQSSRQATGFSANFFESRLSTTQGSCSHSAPLDKTRPRFSPFRTDKRSRGETNGRAEAGD